MMRTPPLRLLAAGFLVLAVPACSLSPRPDPTVFLVLAPPAPAAGTGGAGFADLTLGVGPVVLPAYLQRPQLVSRVDETELRVHEYARWSAPLATLLAEAVGEHLGQALSPRAVAVYPWASAERPGVSVRINVQQFEVLAPDSVVLRARWEVVDRNGARVGQVRTSDHRAAAAGEPREAARALSRLLAQMSADIAAALRTAP